MSIIGASVAELLTRMEQRDLSSVEVTRAYLDQIERYDANIQAFLLGEIHAFNQRELKRLVEN